jgi:hypothetical protein
MNLINSSLNPYVFCYSTVGQTNSTGDGTVVTALFNPIVQGGNFDVTTGIFTCTIPGTFLFTIKPDLSGLSTLTTAAVFNFVTLSKTYQFAAFSPGGWRNAGFQCRYSGYFLIKMSLNDTTYTTVQVSNGTKTTAVATTSLFSVIRLF